MTMTPRNETGKSTIPAGISQVGNLTSTGTNKTLQRTTVTAWAVGAVTILELKVYTGDNGCQVFQNITGTNTATPPPNDKTNWVLYNAPEEPYLWIYIPNIDGAGTQAVGKITGIAPNLNESAETYTELYYVDREMDTTGAVAWQLVEGTLKSYSVHNNGGSAGELDGEVFADEEILNNMEKIRLWGNPYYEVIPIDATGTNFYIIENGN